MPNSIATLKRRIAAALAEPSHDVLAAAAPNKIQLIG